MGFALIRRSLLEQCKGNAHSLSLDLFAQWQGFEKNGQWRFTPPPMSWPPSCKRSTSTPPREAWQVAGHAMP